MVLLVAIPLACKSAPPPPAQSGVTLPQFNQRMAEVEKRLRALEEATPAPSTRAPADLKKEFDDIKLRLNLVETRPLPGGLSPEEKTLLDGLEKRVKALEPTPTPRPTPTPIRTPTPTSTPPASAAALATLEKRLEALEKQVQQLDRRLTPSPTVAPTAIPTPTADLNVINHNGELSKDRKSITIAGEIVNNGNAVASPLIVVATLYKIDGTVLGYGRGTPVITALPPKQSTPFSITITGLDFTTYNSYVVRPTTASTSN